LRERASGDAAASSLSHWREAGLIAKRVLLLAAALVAGVPAAPIQAAPKGIERCDFNGSPKKLKVGASCLFAELPDPDPGNSEGAHPDSLIAHAGHIYVGTTSGFSSLFSPLPTPPSQIFVYQRTNGKLKEVVQVEGENLRRAHGVGGMAFDAKRRLYAAQGPQGQNAVLRFELPNGQPELYATLPPAPVPLPAQAPGCIPTPPPANQAGCGFPNDLDFDRAGNLYVTDSWRGAIYRVPPGGGTGTVYFQDPRLGGWRGAGVPPVLPGVNGIRVSPDGKSLYVTVTTSNVPPNVPFPSNGYLYKLPIQGQPNQAQLAAALDKPVASFGPDQPDGLAIGKSGKVYVVLGRSNQLAIVSPDGSIERFGSAFLANPSSVEFDHSDRSVFITNHDFTPPPPGQQPPPAKPFVVRMYVGDIEAERAEPRIP
jgi:DNA-binding beta-propeller fold protein YncE